jgi:ATP-dependent Lon protease
VTVDALRDLKRRAILHPDDPGAAFALAEALAVANEAAEARRVAEKALATHPAHGNLVRLAVACCRKEGRTARARELLDAAVAAAPDDAALRDERAAVLEEEGRPDDALLDREVADRLAPGDEGRLLDLAQGYARRGLATRALRCLGRLATPEAVRLAASLRERHPALADGLLERAAAALPAGAPALADAVERLRRGDGALARRALARAGEAERASVAHAYLRAELLRRDGREAEAASALARAGLDDPPRGGPVPDHAAIGWIGALGWAPGAGCVSPVQAVAVAGEGRLSFSGNVGQVGRDAGEVAWTCVRAVASRLVPGSPPPREAGLGRGLGLADALRGKDLHLHFVDTEIAKDGPSAGIALWLAGVSALSGRPLRGRLAATGELTLHGEVRPVGGLHEKLVAARLAGVARVIAPRANRRELAALPAEVTRAVELVQVDDVAGALEAALAADPGRTGR